MPDNKQKCKSCQQRHIPPTGKKCKFLQATVTDHELSRDAAGPSGATLSQVRPDKSTDGQLLQEKILEQLERVTQRLEMVEGKMAASTSHSTPTQELSTDSFLESVKPSKKQCKKQKLSVDLSPEENVKGSKKLSKKHKVQSDSSFEESVKHSKKGVKKYIVSSDSSSDESDTPSLELLRSKQLQKKVDKRIRELNQCSQSPGKECQTVKSKRGGGVDIVVKQKVLWPHEAILGGVTRQRVNYDQLSLTQWVQGFCRNILDQKSTSRQKSMVAYLGDLMEDATDFSLQGAKAAHAVLLCEMERGTVTWEDQERIDRIRRAHAQKHISGGRQNWGRPEVRKPWFCKNFQSNSCSFPKDHESNGRLHRHICAFCLSQGKQLSHSKKKCQNKTHQVKNETPAAHH